MLPIQLLLLWSMAHPMAPELTIVIGTLASVIFAWRVYVLFEIPLLELLGRRKCGAIGDGPSIASGPRCDLP
jgi:peptidoglycan/LPS O-acetylase OafA/YrhL